MHRDGRVRIGGTATMIAKDGFCSDSEIYNVNAFRVRRAITSTERWAVFHQFGVGLWPLTTG